MKSKIINSIINIIQKYYNYDEKKIKEIRYGLESIYLSLFKLIIVLIISTIIHTLKELCIFILLYGVLRLTAFGLHTKNSIQCWILSIITFTLIPYLIKTTTIDKNVMLISCLLLLILIIVFAPADTEKRPLINKNKRLIFKILSTIISIIYIYLIYINHNYKYYLFFSLLLETILILPITYKLLGLKYNNYKSYKRKEVQKWNYLLKLQQF